MVDPTTERSAEWLTGYRTGSVMDTAYRRFAEVKERRPNRDDFTDLTWVNGYAKCLLDAKQGIATWPEQEQSPEPGEQPLFDALENFAQWCLGASPEAEGMVEHIIDNARGALAHAAELKAARVSSGWLPIEDAPVDGQEVLCMNEAGDVFLAMHYAGAWYDQNSGMRDPKRWAPIPARSTPTKSALPDAHNQTEGEK